MNKDKITIISAEKKNYLSFYDLFLYKDLLYFMVKREVTVLYKQTILGFSWAIIRPFFSMIIFSIIFGGLAKIPSDDIPYPLFSYAALVPWTYFSTSMVKSTQSLIGSTSIFSKVYFPRIVIPLAPILACLVDFFIALAIVFFMMIYYDISVSFNIFYLPYLILLMILTSSGLGMWLSALAIQYRDIRHAIAFVSQILMYLAPVVWPVSMIQNKYSADLIYFYGLYPMAGVIEGFRSALLGQNPMPWSLLIPGSISAFVMFFLGAIYFKKKEKLFADVA